MILGDVCTRGCRFCATKTGKPLPPNPAEPQQVAESVSLMGLRHVVVTSVTRDDLADGGAAHWAQTVDAIKAKNSNATIELLIPDFDAEPASLEVVMASKPDIIGHNIETVERLTPQVRAKATYRTSLATLRYMSEQGVKTKSGLMLGLGPVTEMYVTDNCRAEMTYMKRLCNICSAVINNNSLFLLWFLTAKFITLGHFIYITCKKFITYRHIYKSRHLCCNLFEAFAFF